MSRYVALPLVCRRADQPADNRADCRRAKSDPSDVPTVMMGVVNDMMPRRRRAMRTMPPPLTRRSNRRASRQRQSRKKNRNRFNGLVHITPATFFSVVVQESISRLQEGGNHTSPNLTADNIIIVRNRSNSCRFRPTFHRPNNASIGTRASK